MAQMAQCPPYQNFFSKTLSPETLKMKELCERNFCGMSLKHFQMYFVWFAIAFSISFYFINVTTIIHFLLIYFEVNLHSCGFKLVSTNKTPIYNFVVKEYTTAVQKPIHL